MKSTMFSATPPGKLLRNLEMGRSITITELPDQIIADILSRLPTKTLFASRCVCKSWLSLTTNDPQFSKLHFSRSRIELLLQFSAFYDANRTLGLVDLELDTTRGFGTRVKIKPQFDTPEHQSSYYEVGYVVVNACGGLICLKDTCINENPAIICNPLTGEYIMLPDCDNCRMGYFYASGFGFCSSTNEYKVLRISSDKLMPFWEDVEESREAEINVVGSSSWRRIGYAPFIPRNTSNPIFTNGVIHWVCDVNRTPKFIVTFDFESEKFGEISPPSQIGKFHHNRKYNMSLGVLGGCLAVCDIFRRGKFDLWVMKEYGIQESWSKDFVIDTTGMGLLLRGKHQPIACLSNGEILMHSLEENNLVCYNPVKNSVRCLKIPWGRHFEAVVHSPSFVSLKDAIKPIIRDNLKVLNVSFQDYQILGRLLVVVAAEKVCDQPHPFQVKNMVCNIIEGKFYDACSGLKCLYNLGYSPTDIITTLYRIIKNYDMAEYLKLEFMKETGFGHMRICDGVGSYIQLCGLLAKLALVRETAKGAYGREKD